VVRFFLDRSATSLRSAEPIGVEGCCYNLVLLF
jgi:hypothetical protein